MRISLGFAWAFGACGVQAQETSLSAPEPYIAVRLDEDGNLAKADLAAVVRDVRTAEGARADDVVVMVHGFNTTFGDGRNQYRRMAQTFRRQSASRSSRLVMIGVHWRSHPGPVTRWLPQMLAYRFATVLGFRNAFRNPYLEKVRAARRAGRRGLRDLLLGLQAELPPGRVHVLAHSLGSEVLLRALSPTPPRKATEPPHPQLGLGLVSLAGADLDQDVFAHPERTTAHHALPQANVWWITCPREKSADGVLELRRGAGRRDAVGNIGLSLQREDFDALMRRRGLVIDDDYIPIGHDILDYYNTQRLRRLAEALTYLRRPEQASQHLLAELDRVILSPPEALKLPMQPGSPLASRMYVRWRLYPQAAAYGPVRITSPL